MKKQETYDIRSQRKLGILDTEFNTNNKIITKTISTHSRELGTTVKEQFVTEGSAAIDQIITKR